MTDVVRPTSFRYSAYGAIAQSSSGAPTLLGFAGEMNDPSGLIYLRARWYDPAAGRFSASDPFLGTPKVPFTLNRYTYASSNPVRFIDPTGLWCAGSLTYSYTVASGLWIAPGGAADTRSVGFGYCHNEETGAHQLGWFKSGGKFDKQDDVQKTVGIYAGLGTGIWWSPNAQSFADIAGPFVTQIGSTPFTEFQYSYGKGGVEVYSSTVGVSTLSDAYTIIITRTEILGTINVPSKGF